MKSRHNKLMSFILLGMIVILSACTKQPPVLDTPLVSETSVTESPTETVGPTETIPARVILVAPQGTDPLLLAGIQDLLSPLSQDAGLVFVTQELLTNEPWKEPVSIVVGMNGVPNLMELVNAHPDVQFLGLFDPGALQAPNLSTISITAEDLQKQAFLAGYMAAVVTPDYRVGVLTTGEDELGRIAADSFFIGAQYFCGLCNSRFGPIEYYPKLAIVSDPTSALSWEAAVDLLLSKAVTTIYIQAEVINPDLVDYLFQNKVKVISPISMQEFTGNENWLGTLSFDPLPGIQLLFPDLVTGKGGLSAASRIILIDTDSGLISVGRMDLIQKTMDELMNGYIKPSSVK
jgi:hypothetical protein